MREENDLFSSGAGRDRAYSQGLLLGWEADPEGSLGRGAAAVLSPLGFLDPLPDESEPDVEHERTLRVFLEQRIYNPRDLDSMDFVPDERPYAGILQLGATARHARLDPDAARRRDWLYAFELALGVTGDWSLGEIAQRGVHYVLGEADAAGWQYQVEEEVIVQTAWDLRNRTLYGRLGAAEFDLVSGARLELGTAFTNGQLGVEARGGHNLSRNDRPWLGLTDDFAIWVSSGVNLRHALYDITIDGSLWNDDPQISLTREESIWQWWFGLTTRWRGFTLGYRFLRQQKEYAQELGPHDWGTIALGYRYSF
ncbi:hypothetical protein Pla86_27110 [Planctomycetes bacterium Pla86]|uniref:DUF2219 domain-containing protein n=1 Tax=Engelhardtia mirabilis TaxID=2528011 RepID=A0A518BKX3_9BACT|nr:hypothetical protein Pla133_27120 [Planctomycetes bacterium Pla133]QDV01950.1 hypothetical protein Pla86_27110 [Planctomycetes bacterium Pla86]